MTCRGPASSKLKPRNVVEPPEKNRSLIGNVRSISSIVPLPSRSRGLKRFARPRVAFPASTVPRSSVHFVITTISGLQPVEGNVSAQLPQRNRVVDIEEVAAGRVKLVVAADFAGRAGFLIRIANRAQQAALASFARVANKRGAKPRKTNRAIRFQDLA